LLFAFRGRLGAACHVWKPGLLERNDSIFDGEPRQSRDGVDVQFLHYPLAMCLDRTHANAQTAGDFFIALPVRN